MVSIIADDKPMWCALTVETEELHPIAVSTTFPHLYLYHTSCYNTAGHLPAFSLAAIWFDM